MRALSFLDTIDTGKESFFLVKNISEVVLVPERDTVGEIFKG